MAEGNHPSWQHVKRAVVNEYQIPATASPATTTAPNAIMTHNGIRILIGIFFHHDPEVPTCGVVGR